VSDSLLSVDGLRMDYPQPSGALAVLGGLSFSVAKGEFLCIVGPSGYGKTTLLRLLAGLERPAGGSIRLAGRDVQQPSRDVGIVFQQPTLMSWRTVEDNVALPLEVAGARKSEARSRARSLLQLVGLAGFEESYPYQLSGGMAQRAALARSLVHDPKLLLLDEPFGSLDALTRERMGHELLRIWRTARKTVVLVTHSVSEAVFLADRVLVLGTRPALFVSEVLVDIARPRQPALLESPRLVSIARRVREALDRAATAQPPPAIT
jgi:NitT/TauT family transport system ATP-binding protein